MKHKVNTTIIDNFKFFAYNKNIKETVKAYLNLDNDYKKNYSPINFVLLLAERTLDPEYIPLIEALLEVDSDLEAVLIEKVTPNLYYLLESVYRRLGLCKCDCNGNTYLHLLMLYGAYDLVISILKPLLEDELLSVCSRVNYSYLTPLMMVIQSENTLCMSAMQFQFFNEINQKIILNHKISTQNLNSFKCFARDVFKVSKDIYGVSYTKFKVVYVCSVLGLDNVFLLKKFINRS